MTMARTIRLFKLPETTSSVGLRPLEAKDCPSACKVLNKYLEKFNIYMHFNEEEFKHWFLPVQGVIDAYVITNSKGEVTDLTSFYTLPSSVLTNPKYKTLKAAYMWYSVATTVDLKQLIRDTLVLANNKQFDVFNCLEIHDNKTFLEELKFGPGDGHLKYYLYNWIAKPVDPDKVGLVLL